MLLNFNIFSTLQKRRNVYKVHLKIILCYTRNKFNKNRINYGNTVDITVIPYIMNGVREIQNDIKKEDYYNRDRNQPSNLQNQNHHR